MSTNNTPEKAPPAEPRAASGPLAGIAFQIAQIIRKVNAQKEPIFDVFRLVGPVSRVQSHSVDTLS